MKKLDWDSIFWGIDIYNYNIKKSTDLSLAYKNKRIIIQSLVDSSDIEAIHYLERNDFHFIQNKLNFNKEITLLSASKNEYIKEVSLNEIVNKIHYVPKMFRNTSRYNLFNEELVGEFYCTWLEKSVKGIFDDGCFGYYYKEDLAGFITYKITHEKLQIGLFGIFPPYQGLGISQSLLDFIEHFASEKKCKFITVSTQGVNYNAINTYTKKGFKLKNISSWYYKEIIK